MLRYSFSYRGKIAYIIVGSVIGFASLVYTNYLAQELANKEKYEIELWSRGYALYEKWWNPRSRVEQDITFKIVKNSTTIPTIITDDYLRVVESLNVDPEVIKDPKRLRSTIEKMCSVDRPPINFVTPDGVSLTVYYDDSALLKSVYFFPYIQLGLIGILFSFAFITLRSSKQNEQNRVWVGMAKETAHQLGTPTSSLLGWIDYIKSQDMLPEVTEEMGKDITRLMKVADRFSKIGSTTQLRLANIYEIVENTINYFQTRIPRNVTLEFEQCVPEPLYAMINDSLFEWVVENLLKNALDALQGKGKIHVRISTRDKWINIDVKDSGKGMQKINFNRIFRPGFTTKARGWGLGLSLSRRIVEEYHHGRIFVKESEIGKGTTFRIMLLKATDQQMEV